MADPGNKALPRIILGIDPGTMATGWGVVQVIGNALRHMGHGTIHSSSAEPQARRLCRIYTELSKVVKEFQPDGVSLEKVFFAQNVQRRAASRCSRPLNKLSKFTNIAR